MTSEVFYQSGDGFLRVAVVGLLAYLALIVLLRGAGPRALSKLNSFDLVVTVALGSTLATILLSRDVALAEGIAAFLTLLGLQYSVSWLSVRSTTVNDLVKSEPILLLYRGTLLRQPMARARVVEGEIAAAVRQQGSASLDTVHAVVLETDGSISVIAESPDGPATALRGVSPEPETDAA